MSLCHLINVLCEGHDVLVLLDVGLHGVVTEVDALTQMHGQCMVNTTLNENCNATNN